MVHRYIKAVGSGQKRARDLTREEAREAMALVCDGKAAPVQVGAFLLALRMKGEAGDELAGFVDTLHARMPRIQAPPGTLDIDCHGDGHLGRPTLLPAAAFAAVALGVPVLLRCDLSSPYAKHGLRAALESLGLDLSRPLDGPRAVRGLVDHRIAVLDLAASCAPLKRLVDLRPQFGVRTVAQTLMKLIDPLFAEARLVGVFHAPYLPSTAQALAALGPTRALCVQALGGLPEVSPGKQARVAWAGAPEPTLLDLRSLPAPPDGPAPDDNLAALAGQEPALSRAAAAGAALLHAALGTPILEAAAQIRSELAGGRARAAAASLEVW